MASTLTVSDIQDWISAATGSSVVLAATPTAETLALLQNCLDSSIASIERYCNLPDVYPVEVEQAILMQAARLWDRRKTANGISAGDFGAVRVGTYDADVEALLAPYRRWSFG